MWVCAGAPRMLGVSSRHEDEVSRALELAELLLLVLAGKFVPLLYTETTRETRNRTGKQELSCYCLNMVVKSLSPCCKDGNILQQKKS